MEPLAQQLLEANNRCKHLAELVTELRRRASKLAIQNEDLRAQLAEARRECALLRAAHAARSAGRRKQEPVDEPT
jgi:uncharacterized membrane protein